jgi:hypothetical protein
MKGMRLAAIVALATAVSAPAHADNVSDFANQLHTYDIHGQRDYNAWLGSVSPAVNCFPKADRCGFCLASSVLPERRIGCLVAG